jgi:hypothetical protein
MAFEWETIKAFAEDSILIGGVLMGGWYTIRRMYLVARNVEKLVESADKNERTQRENSRQAAESRSEIKKNLEEHIKLEEERDSKRDLKFDKLASGVETLATELRDHVKMEEDRDLIRDQQLVQLTDHMDEIISEMRPNGGSSMKDIVNKTAEKMNDVHTRVAVLEQRQEEHTVPPSKKPRRKKIRKMVRKTIRKTRRK